MIYQKGSNLFNVAIYIRLSREDGDKEESDSVGNQRKLLTEYVNKHDDFILYDVYIDDGFTGTNFNRPDFHRMVADIEDNKVNCKRPFPFRTRLHWYGAIFGKNISRA